MNAESKAKRFRQMETEYRTLINAHVGASGLISMCPWSISPITQCTSYCPFITSATREVNTEKRWVNKNRATERYRHFYTIYELGP